MSDQIEKSVEKSVGLGRRNARHGDLCIISGYQSTMKPQTRPSALTHEISPVRVFPFVLGRDKRGKTVDSSVHKACWRQLENATGFGTRLKSFSASITRPGDEYLGHTLTRPV